MYFLIYKIFKRHNTINRSKLVSDTVLNPAYIRHLIDLHILITARLSGYELTVLSLNNFHISLAVSRSIRIYLYLQGMHSDKHPYNNNTIHMAKRLQMIIFILI